MRARPGTANRLDFTNTVELEAGTRVSGTAGRRLYDTVTHVHPRMGPTAVADEPKLLTIKRESKNFEFKEQFDVDSKAEWTEIIKDVVAIANSGGGWLVFGLTNLGKPTAFDATRVLAVDPADVTNKINKYTGIQFSDFEMTEIQRDGQQMAALRVGPARTPMVFVEAGQYAVGAVTNVKTAFQKGTVYFRHGAKSEPGNTEDLKIVLDRELERTRKAWLKGIRKVVAAPEGAQLEVLPPGATVVFPAVQVATAPAKAAPAVSATQGPMVLAPLQVGTTGTPVRLVDDPSVPVVAKLDPDDTHPHRQKELAVEINKKLLGNAIVTSYDILAIRAVHQINETTSPLFVHKFKHGSRQYSHAFPEWIMEQYKMDQMFFAKTREEFKKANAAKSP